MPNSLSATGLTVASTSEIITNLQNAFYAIYGNQANLSANSPDGQLIAILAQNIQDTLQLLTQVYASFSLQNSYGVILDQRVAMSGLIRNAGTYTIAYVSATSLGAGTLPGQDVLVANPGATVFTVSDTAGNQYQLQSSYVFSGVATVSLVFVAVTLGQIQTVPNTIQTIVTVFTFIASVNNPTTASDIQGLPEETDPQLKIRQANSYYLQAVSPADAVRAALLSAPNFTITGPCADAFVAENDTASVALGVPANGIWVIVNPGTATPQQIGTTIYAKKSSGCAMTGAQSYIVVRPQGNTFTALWDLAQSQALYIMASLYPKVPGQEFDVTADGIALAAALVYRLGQSPNPGDVVVAMQTIEPLAIVANCQISKDGVTWVTTPLAPNTFQKYYLTSAVNITLVNA